MTAATRIKTLSLWRQVAGETRRHAGALLVVGFASRLIVGAAFGPIGALLLLIGLWADGQPVVTDLGILSLAASPLGLVAGAAAAVTLLSGWAFELVAMVMIVRERASTPWGALRDSLYHTVTIARVVARVMIQSLRWLLPAVGVVGATYALMLSRYDINYYLIEKPPALWVALAIAGVAALVSLWGVSKLLARWLSAPALIADGLTARQTTHESAAHAAALGGTSRLALAQWLAASLAAPALLTGLVTLVFSVAAPWWPKSLVGVATGLGLYLLATWAAAFACSFLGAAALAGLSNALVDAPADRKRQHDAARGKSWITRGRVVAAVGVLLVGSAAAGFFALGEVETNTTVDVIAHRGAALVAPENTLASVEAAIEAGADWVEIDVQETLDGEVIVMHDSDFMKAAGVATKVWDVTMEELATIDVGSQVGPEFAGERVPTLTQVLDACRDRVGLLVELKYYGHEVELERRVAERVEAAGMVDQTRFMSLKPEGVRKLKELRPGWDVGVLLSVYVGRASQLEADFLAMNASFIGPRFTRQARRQGRDVYAWTVNDPVQMASLASAGVRGIITDDPVLARETLAQWRELSPVGRLLVHTAGRVSLEPKNSEQ